MYDLRENESTLLVPAVRATGPRTGLGSSSISNQLRIRSGAWSELAVQKVVPQVRRLPFTVLAPTAQSSIHTTLGTLLGTRAARGAPPET